MSVSGKAIFNIWLSGNFRRAAPLAQGHLKVSPAGFAAS
jgi:hypothetical protein